MYFATSDLYPSYNNLERNFIVFCFLKTTKSNSALQNPLENLRVPLLLSAEARGYFSLSF